MLRNKKAYLTPGATLTILVLAPLALGAKGGCSHAVVGDEGACKTNCGEAGMQDGATGGGGGSTAGTAGRAGGSASGGMPGASGHNATGGGPAQGGSGGTMSATGGGPAAGGSSGSSALGGTSGTGGSAAGAGGSLGAVCGGLRGSSCTSTQFCDFPADAQCGRADATGNCATKPDACDTLYAPVCGCDGMTYSNDCDAHMHGVSVETTGACGGVICGGITGAACADGEYCDFPLSASCGSADQSGTCQPIPNGCTKENVPVCGCDGVTYGNACTAHAQGISVAATGDCAAPPDVCGGIAAMSCPDGKYCDFPLEAKCGDGDMTGGCEIIPDGCTAQYDPVCGCDGVTYGNTCEAARAGMSVRATGECPT